MRRICKTVACAAAAASLMGCLVPEKFEAALRFKPDGAYAYEYKGTAVHFMAAAALQKRGRLEPREEQGLRQEAEKDARTPGVRRMAYTGEGRYDIDIAEEVAAGQQVRSFKIFSLSRDKDDAYVVKAPALTDKDREGLKSVGIRVNGTAQVYLPPNAKVLEHNAGSTPGFFSKAYGWKIGSVDDRPVMRFTLPQ